MANLSPISQKSYLYSQSIKLEKFGVNFLSKYWSSKKSSPVTASKLNCAWKLPGLQILTELLNIQEVRNWPACKLDHLTLLLLILCSGIWYFFWTLCILQCDIFVAYCSLVVKIKNWTHCLSLVVILFCC